MTLLTKEQVYGMANIALAKAGDGAYRTVLNALRWELPEWGYTNAGIKRMLDTGKWRS
jgi:hypothetical protein